MDDLNFPDSRCAVERHLERVLPRVPRRTEVLAVELQRHPVRVGDAHVEDLRPLGVYLRNFFPKGANVNFFELAEDGHVELLTYERGVEDFTLACGTGSGCTVSHLVALGRAKPEGTSVHVPGGWLEVAVEGGKYSPSHDIYLAGPTEIAYEGETKI